MAEEKHCDECGGKLPTDAPQGLCPQCLMKLGLPSDAQSALPTSPTAPAPFIPPEPKQLARQFPQLEIIELLGQGGMGAVYKARQKHLDRLVALKILPPQIGQDPAFAERFTREARSLARLNHPQIVTVFEFGHTEDGLYYFIMEYIDGTDLRQLINAADLSPKEALAIVPQICAALQFAHEEGIVHRDIKPENILIDKKGRIKIADFGLARLLDQPAKAYTLTQAGQRMGTPHYMAPEQIEHPGQVDHRADIYSLGVVFYEMLTGELPIGRFDPPSQKVRIDVRLDEIVLHTLEKEPQRRYQHASQLKTDIETVSASPQAPNVPKQHFHPPASSAMEAHITVVAALNIIFGFIRLLIAAFLFVIITGAGLISGDPTAMQVTGIVGSALSLLVSLTAIPTIVGGFGLLKRKPWARILIIILAILDLLTIPLSLMAGPHLLWKMVGIALAVYTLWVLFNKESIQIIRQSTAPEETPPAPNSPQSPAIAPPARPQHPATAVKTVEPTALNISQAARAQLRIPAIGLIIAGILTCLAPPIAFAALVVVKEIAGHSFVTATALPAVFIVVIIISSFVVGFIILLGASKMLRLRSYGFCVATAILALLPCYAACPIGLPFAIWALVVLSNIKTQAAFARQNHPPAQARTSTAKNLFILLVIALIVFGGAVVIIRTMPWLRRSHPALPGPPLSFNIELPSEKVGQFDFPAGIPDNLEYKLDGPILSNEGVSALDLTTEQAAQVNRILRTAYAEYAELERKNSQFKTSTNSLSVTVSPFRQQATDFLEKIWPEIDAVVDQSQRPLIHKHLPLGRIFGTFGFGKHKITANISKRSGRFAYSVSWHHTEGPGPRGQLSNISSDSSRKLPLELHRFWNAAFETTPAKRSESSVDKYVTYGTSPPDPCISP